MLNFLHKVFLCDGKTLTGELSCRVTGDFFFDFVISFLLPWAPELFKKRDLFSKGRIGMKTRIVLNVVVSS